MAPLRLAGLVLVGFLVVFGGPLAAIEPQPPAEPDSKQLAAIQKIQHLLNERLIDGKSLQTEIPLAKFLQAVEKQLPKDKRIALRIDGDALGDKRAEVAAMPMAMPKVSPKVSLRTVLEAVIAKSKIKLDYRPGTAEVVLTTPEKALYVAAYDIGDLHTVPEFITDKDGQIISLKQPLLTGTPAEKGARVVKALVAWLDHEAGKPPSAAQSIEMENGTRLVIRSNAANHAMIADMLLACRRLGDVAVIFNARLFEVDEPFHKKLLKAKRLPLEEAERLFLEGKATDFDELFKLLDKQTLVLTGERARANHGEKVALLSRHQAITCLPSPEQVRRGDKGRQTILEGVSFVASVQVSPDRRSVHLKFTEKAVEVQEIQKVKVFDPGLRGDVLPPDVKPRKFVEAEIPLVKEATQTQSLEIPDGGSVLVAVHYRPAAAQAKERWWVLCIQARISIEEEEQQERIMELEAILPAVVDDILKNPRLKLVRECYGTAGDTRFAVLDSDVWTWPAKFPFKGFGVKPVPAERKGNRLLGIRVDHYQGAGFFTLPRVGGASGAGKETADAVVTISLVNAGGTANGAVAGSCTLRYTVRNTDKGRVSELADPMD
jgi:hypothetical protein